MATQETISPVVGIMAVDDDEAIAWMNDSRYELTWTGVKDSGRGVTLSRYGYDALTRPKSFHLRTEF